MKRFLGLIALAVLPGAAAAQVGGAYWMRWSNTGGDAGTLTGGSYYLQALAGTPGAGYQQGGNYVLYTWAAIPTTVDAKSDPVPHAFVMRAPTPSPFRDQVAIGFELPEPQHVSLLVHSVDGRLVRRLMDRDYVAGRHTIFWDAKDQAGRSVASGVYFVRLTAGVHSATRRLVRLD